MTVHDVDCLAGSSAVLSRIMKRARVMLNTRIDVLYVCLLVCLTSLTDVKFGPVQVSEVVSLIGLVIVGPMILLGSRIPAFASDRASLLAILGFFFVASLGACTAYFNATFYTPGDVTTLLKQPGWLSAARLFQLTLVYMCFAAIVYAAKYDESITGKCVRLYIFGLTLSAIYGIVSYVLERAVGISLGGAYGTEGLRLRAFFVEGGPFGLFAGSGLIMLFAQWDKRFLSRKATYLCGSIITVALLLAQSKAAVFAMFITMLIALCFYGIKAIRAYLMPLLLIGFVIAVLAWVAGAGKAFDTIMTNRAALLEEPELIGDDPNVVAGRIAGSFIVPEMIMAHPVLGVGIGNYSLLRNSPQYNKVMPSLDYWDLPGLGLYGFLAEVGLLGGLTLVIFFLIPALAARRANAPFGLIMLSCYPLVALVFGVQPTFLYPWVVFGVAVVMIRQYRGGLPA